MSEAPGSESDDLDIVHEFLTRFAKDRRTATVRSLEAYQRLWPGHAATIAREFALLDAGDAGEPIGPQRVGPYEIRRELGRGGQAVVYLAHDPRLQRDIALKVLGTAASSLDQQLRLQREATVSSRLDDAGICPVFETGRDGSHLWLAMQYVPGQTLAQRLTEAQAKDTPLPLATALDWCRRLLRSLQRAHAAGIVHRDLKPANVMIAADGRPVLLDFGLAAEVGSAGPLLTRSGDRFGTPAYLAPEHFRGGGHDGVQGDLWAFAVTMYEVLTGHRPFDGPTIEALQRAILTEEPIAARRRRPELPRDLAAVLTVALDKAPQRRYRSAADLLADLDAVVAGRPITARPPGPVRRLLLWHRRHAVVATALWTVSLGAVSFAERSLANQRLAANLDGKVREFDLLSGVVLHERAESTAQELFPSHPEQRDALQTWLTQQAEPLLQLRTELDRTLTSLRQRAMPRSAAQRDADRRAHPRFAELRQLEQIVAARRWTLAQRQAGASPVEPPLPAALQQATANELGNAVLARVAVRQDRRTIYDEAPLGLACARAAVAWVAAGDTTLPAHDAAELLAWALLANGQDQAAIDTITAAASSATGPLAELVRGRVLDITTAVRTAATELVSEQQRLAALQMLVETELPHAFAVESQQFLHDTLAALRQRLETFANRTVPAVRSRLRWASCIGELTRHHPRARHTWDEVRRDLRSARTAPNAPIELPEQGLVGLVPIGKNPATGLWEFYDLRSAWDGSADPADIPIPTHRPDGSIEVTDALGIVFVCLPGGTFPMGADELDDAKPAHPVTLAPFLLARHELTQGQWQRLWNGDPALAQPSKFTIGMQVLERYITHANPVEQVSWTACARLAHEHGLLLPTEAQWEYACRAGTATVFSCEPEQLAQSANVADAAAARATHWPKFEAWDDGHVVTAPVGSFAPNAFGMYDMHGNVAEWCRDEFTPYTIPVAADSGLRPGDGNHVGRIHRGGAFNGQAMAAACAQRDYLPEAQMQGMIGVRLARALR